MSMSRADPSSSKVMMWRRRHTNTQQLASNALQPSWPGPLRPGKLRLMALTLTWAELVEAPGPQLAQAPQAG